MTEADISRVGSRRELIRFLDGYSLERKDELDERKLKRPLVKTHLLEVLDGRQERNADQYKDLFGRRGLTLNSIDDGLFSVRDNSGPIGFLERLRPRIVALYSTMEAQKNDRWGRLNFREVICDVLKKGLEITLSRSNSGFIERVNNQEKLASSKALINVRDRSVAECIDN